MFIAVDDKPCVVIAMGEMKIESRKALSEQKLNI